MPADARTLLRAAAQERKGLARSEITHPLASYHPSTGALRCSACNYVVIKHDSLWAAHVVSKSHRAHAAELSQWQAVRQQEEDDLRRMQAQQNKDGKRKATESDDLASDTDYNASVDASASKKARTTETTAADPEWELFKRQMEASEQSPAGIEEQRYSSQAIVEVQPHLLTDGEAALQTSEDEATPEELAARARLQQEQEEREEILSRYEEEQRLQDEADERVSALKSRLERIRQSRKQKTSKTKP